MSEGPRYLVLGASGMLGRAWCRVLDERGVEHTAASRPDIDVTDAASIAAAVTGDVDVVVNCTAYTDVDGAESDEATATRVNGEAVGLLAARAKAVGAVLVHYSTDYVFNGTAAEPYPVDTPHDPINAYGRSKAVGERLLMGSGCDYRLIRTSWLYAPWGRNFVLTMHRLTAENETLNVVSDQRGRPTSCEHLATVSMRLVEDGASGVYHVSDGGQCTWMDFAAEVGRLAGHACRVGPKSSADFPRPAKRPAYSVMDLSTTEAVAGPMPPWQTNLADVMRRVGDGAASK